MIIDWMATDGYLTVVLTTRVDRPNNCILLEQFYIVTSAINVRSR